MYNLAIFVSGRGSNLLSIASKINSGKINAKIAAVVSNKADCQAIEFAKEENIPTYVVSKPEADQSSVSYEDLTKSLKESEINLIVLAGFLKKIPVELIKEFKNKKSSS